jgi:uncharacterized protein YeaO (DUF488 family)
MIKIKRIYDTPAEDDGFRILVDRWPRGLAKSKGRFVAKGDRTSDQLQSGMHDPKKWLSLEKIFHDWARELVNQIVQKMKEGTSRCLQFQEEINKQSH